MNGINDWSQQVYNFNRSYCFEKIVLGRLHNA